MGVLENKLKSATGLFKSQIFVKGFVNRFQINVTINYASNIFFFMKEYYNSKTYLLQSMQEYI